MLTAFSECVPTTAPYACIGTLKYYYSNRFCICTIIISVICCALLLITIKLAINCTSFALGLVFNCYICCICLMHSVSMYQPPHLTGVQAPSNIIIHNRFFICPIIISVICCALLLITIKLVINCTSFF